MQMIYGEGVSSCSLLYPIYSDQLCKLLKDT
jgi:hypothetical protein